MASFLLHLLFLTEPSRSAHFTLANADAPAVLQAAAVVLAQTQALLAGIVRTELVGDIALEATTDPPAVKISDGAVRIFVHVPLDAESELRLREGVMERVLQTDVLGYQPWATRGLAQWASTATAASGGSCKGAAAGQGARTGGKLCVGAPPPDFVFFNTDVAAPNGPAWFDTRQLPSLPELVAATSADFSDDKRGHLFHAGAWMLIALTQDTRLHYAPILARFADVLRCGMAAKEAWTEAAGKQGDALEKDYREYLVRHGAAPSLKVAVSPQPGAANESPQDLTTSAREKLKAGDLAAGETLAAQAVVQQPGCARCLDTLAYAYFAEHRAPEAEQAEARAAVLSSDKGIAERLAKYRGLREMLGQKVLSCRPRMGL